MTATKKKEKVVWIVCTFREIYYVVLSSSYFLDNIELTNKYNLAHTIDILWSAYTIDYCY